VTLFPLLAMVSGMSHSAGGPAQVALMSIRPLYADRIFRGEKRFEIRRRAVRLDPGALVLVYVSSPVKALVGAFTVKRVHVGSPNALWRRYSDAMGVSRLAYEEYLRGVSLACAIEVGEIIMLPETPLADLRAADEAFRPPQSYMFLSERHNPSLSRVAAVAWERACAAD
jgi:predicted transcriptional regulator